MFKRLSSKFMVVSVIAIGLITFPLALLFLQRWLIVTAIGSVVLAWCLSFCRKRHVRYVEYCIFFDICSSDQGDIIELGVVGIDSKSNLHCLKLRQLVFNCLLNVERTYFVVESINPLIIGNVTLFESLIFESYSDAIAALNSLVGIIKLDIKNNLSLLRIAEIPRKNIKKYSGLFGIFRR